MPPPRFGCSRGERKGVVDVKEIAEGVDEVLRAAPVFAAVTAEALAQLGDRITLPQLRVLTAAAEAGCLSNADVARLLDVHISNASRLCDRLVDAGLLDRRDSEVDRRQVTLTATAAGRDLLDVVTVHRRSVFTRVLTDMATHDREALVRGLPGFVRSGQQHVTRVRPAP